MIMTIGLSLPGGAGEKGRRAVLHGREPPRANSEFWGLHTQFFSEDECLTDISAYCLISNHLHPIAVSHTADASGFALGEAHEDAAAWPLGSNGFIEREEAPLGRPLNRADRGFVGREIKYGVPGISEKKRLRGAKAVLARRLRPQEHAVNTRVNTGRGTGKKKGQPLRVGLGVLVVDSLLPNNLLLGPERNGKCFCGSLKPA